MQLYDFEFSGNAYKVRLFMALNELKYERIPVDLLAGEQRQNPYLNLNPKGEVPVLVDGDAVIPDSQAILIYLTEKYNLYERYPNDPVARARIQLWLSTAAKELALGPATARLIKKFGIQADYDVAVEISHALLRLLNSHLQDRKYLECGSVTLADIAMFPYIALSGEAEIQLSAYPEVCDWILRIKSLSGFVPMPGLDFEPTTS